ncbi:hypothetical protein [Streptomyces sp. NPDC053069]|uniref:hypothetical protein n=1 Tax=Streptomyces sp. NPDC053069 TaxID=3365695 RepID=UPI0037D5A52C
MSLLVAKIVVRPGSTTAFAVFPRTEVTALLGLTSALGGPPAPRWCRRPARGPPRPLPPSPGSHDHPEPSGHLRGRALR